ncbi:MAG TPA: di-heme oxidoredictase family protein [Gammaproteobacteria bacterium]|nr:di-heme oxidoredictase family protein [Gammaproteobacteria bacterium]
MIRHHRHALLAVLGVAALGGAPHEVRAQLNECALIDALGLVDAPGGFIDGKLSEQIGMGQGDINLPGSSAYLIARDPARAIRRGRQVFQRKWSTYEGLGPRVTADSTGDILATRRLGAGLSDSCAACHGRPRGSAGAGGDVATFPDSRDAPHLFGLGLIEMLADEMTTDLRAIREQALREARTGVVASATGQTAARPGRPAPVTRPLVTKGVSFGRITAFPDGRLDTTGVTGVDANLRVKPFLHQGGTASIREFLVGAFHAEMGLQAWDPVLCAATDPTAPRATQSAAGFKYDPALDNFERPPACNATEDTDVDGKANEIDPALVDYVEFYLLNYFKPGQYRVTPRAARGLQLMQGVGCVSCHVQNLTVRNDRRVADVDTKYDPARGIFNDLFATVTPLVRSVPDGAAYPKQQPLGGQFVVRNVFTDLKRHDLGPLFQERDFDGTRITMHVTEPLWGVGTTAPYGHDGRSVTLDAVIRRHGGEAAASARAYRALSADDQENVVAFLQTLVLFPPDDTASNLDPGVPNSDDPQTITNHGSINLSGLFQTPGKKE